MDGYEDYPLTQEGRPGPPPAPNKGFPVMAAVVVAVLVLLVVGFLLWLAAEERRRQDDGSTPLRWACDQRTGGCIKVFEDDERAAYDLDDLVGCEADCSLGDEALGYICRTPDFQCELRANTGGPRAGESAFEYEDECKSFCVDPDSDGSAYSCDPLTGECRPDNNGQHDEPTCGDSCVVSLYRCNEGTGQCNPSREGVSLAECRRTCRFRCSNQSGRCEHDPTSPFSVAECAARCAFSCNAEGRCVQDERSNAWLGQCEADCRPAAV